MLSLLKPYAWSSVSENRMPLLGENGYMYTYDWVPLTSIWNCHNLVNWLYSNIKYKGVFLFFKKKKRKKERKKICCPRHWGKDIGSQNTWCSILVLLLSDLQHILYFFLNWTSVPSCVKWNYHHLPVLQKVCQNETRVKRHALKHRVYILLTHPVIAHL